MESGDLLSFEKHELPKNYKDPEKRKRERGERESGGGSVGKSERQKVERVQQEKIKKIKTHWRNSKERKRNEQLLLLSPIGSGINPRLL